MADLAQNTGFTLKKCENYLIIDVIIRKINRVEKRFFEFDYTIIRK